MNLHSGRGRSAPHAAIGSWYCGVARSRGNYYSVDGRIRQITENCGEKAPVGLVVRYFDRDLIRIGALCTAFSYRGDHVEVMTSACDCGVLVGRRFKKRSADAPDWAARNLTTINVITLGGTGAIIPIESYGVRSSGGGSGSGGTRSGASDGEFHGRSAGRRIESNRGGGPPACSR